MKGYLCILIAVMSTSLYGQFLEKEPSSTLAPLPPPKPTVFGVSFESSPPEVEVDMVKNQTSLIKSLKAQRDVLYQIYQGTPPFSVPGVASYMKFFEDQLITMTFKFKPSFESYLILKDQLSKDVGKRYTIKEKESIDPYLKAHLLGIQGDGISPEVEKEVLTSVAEDKSVFYIQFEDTKKICDVSLYWTPSARGRGTMLGVTYKYLSGEKALEKLIEAQDKSRRSLLPQ